MGDREYRDSGGCVGGVEGYLRPVGTGIRIFLLYNPSPRTSIP